MNRKPTPADVRAGSCLVLGSDYQWGREPKHALEIPPCWSKSFDGDFNWPDANHIGLTREHALVCAAGHNADHLDDTEMPAVWFLVFELGEIGDTSFVNLVGGTSADFSLDCSLSLVKPTPAEIKRYCPKIIRPSMRAVREKAAGAA